MKNWEKNKERILREWLFIVLITEVINNMLPGLSVTLDVTIIEGKSTECDSLLFKKKKKG